jgi:MFS family permease
MQGRLWPIFLANVFTSLHYATILYVNSSFLGQFFDERAVSILFILGAVFNIALFLLAPRLLRRLGLRTLYSLFVLLTALALVGFAFSSVPFVVALFFVIYAGAQFMVYYCLDIFLEDSTINERTGAIRGLYLTFSAAAIASAPLFLTFFVRDNELAPVYLTALALLAAPFLLGLFVLRTKQRKRQIHLHATSLPWKAWWQADGLRRATLARVVLEVFYALMVIYTPLYLHTHIGFEWKELGIIFPVMLLPFVIFEWPMGELADRKYGEKEIMSIGFFLTGLSLLVMPFLGKAFFAWMAILFLSRVGASFVEITTESHFFKHVDSRDTSLIGIFRLARPIGLIVGSLLGIISFIFLPFSALFLVVAVVVFLGLKESLYLKDTL